MKKDYKAKATVGRKKRIFVMVFVCLLMCLCVFALMLSIYSFASDNIVFGISYIIAIILGLSYIVIKFNQIYSTFVAADDSNLILKCWDNHFFPYNTWSGIPVLREFIPARSETLTVPMDEIETVMIGTKSYIKRNADDEEFKKEIIPYEKHKYSGITRSFEKFNILYIRAKSGESCFMSIDGFEPSEVMEVINRFSRFCDDSVLIKINSRSYKKYLKRPEVKAEENTEAEEVENKASEETE